MQTTNDIELSVVVPCYNEEKCVEAFVAAVIKVLKDVSFEFVFVDDGSSDETLPILKRLSANDSRVRFLSFSRNFGKEAALLAGLTHAKGRLVVTMDVDGQDPPEILPDMMRAIREEGFDCAATFRLSREGEPPIRSWFARRFYWLMRKFSDVELVDGARDYRMMTRQVVDAIVSLPEVNRFTKGIYQWVGFKTKWIPFKHAERLAGETKWSFWKLFRYSLEGIMAFSTMPLQIASALGLLSCFISFCSLLFVVIRRLVCGDPVAGWASLVCVVVFLGGIQLLFIGILGGYLAKTYLETKRRPMYFIREKSED